MIGRVPQQDQVLYQTERYSSQTFGYDMPVSGDALPKKPLELISMRIVLLYLIYVWKFNLTQWKIIDYLNWR